MGNNMAIYCTTVNAPGKNCIESLFPVGKEDCLVVKALTGDLGDLDWSLGSVTDFLCALGQVT